MNDSSLKQKFIKQNKQLFGNEIYLRKLSTPKLKKVKIHDSWYISLKNEFDKEYWKNLSNQIRTFYSKKIIYPKASMMFNALKSTPLNRTKVVILGQDPYQVD